MKQRLHITSKKMMRGVVSSGILYVLVLLCIIFMAAVLFSGGDTLSTFTPKYTTAPVTTLFPSISIGSMGATRELVPTIIPTGFPTF